MLRMALVLPFVVNVSHADEDWIAKFQTCQEEVKSRSAVFAEKDRPALEIYNQLLRELGPEVHERFGNLEDKRERNTRFYDRTDREILAAIRDQADEAEIADLRAGAERIAGDRLKIEAAWRAELVSALTGKYKDRFARIAESAAKSGFSVRIKDQWIEISYDHIPIVDHKGHTRIVRFGEFSEITSTAVNVSAGKDPRDQEELSTHDYFGIHIPACGRQVLRERLSPHLLAYLESTSHFARSVPSTARPPVATPPPRPPQPEKVPAPQIAI
ncbi:MAG: hypothetical protein AB7G93_17020 [Bdellovibrionales bacterium]